MDKNEQSAQDQAIEPSILGEAVNYILMGKKAFGEDAPVDIWLIEALKNTNIQQVIMGYMWACYAVWHAKSLREDNLNAH